MGSTSFPKLYLGQAIREAHQRTQYGREVVYNLLAEVMVTPGMKSIISQIVETFPICTMNNPSTRPPRGPQVRSIQTRGTYPEEDWQIDVTVMPRVLGDFRYLLVLVDTFSGG